MRDSDMPSGTAGPKMDEKFLKKADKVGLNEV